MIYKHKKRLDVKEFVFDCIIVIPLLLFTLLCLYPFYYVIIYSISDPSLISTNPVYLFPSGFSLQTYISLFSMNDIFGAFLISLFRTLLGTSITVLISAAFAYLVSNKKMLFRVFVYRFMIITMYVGGGLIPWYLTMKMYGLRNNFLLYIIPGALSAYFVILVKTYIESLPASLEESAMIDGAGIWTIFIKIIFPLCKPVVATIAVFAAVGQWNSWSDNYFLVSEKSLQTLQLILYNYLHQAESLVKKSTLGMTSQTQLLVTPMTVKMCITVVATMPILFAYPFLQKYFVKGIMMGAVKG